MRNVPETYIVPEPVYVFTAPFSIFTLPSMNIVPFTVSTFVAAFQESSPAEALQVYDEAGVRSWTVVKLLLRFAGFGAVAKPWSLSKLGGVPLDCRHP